MLHNLAESNSIVCNYMRELRDVEVQADQWRFRSNLQRIGRVMGYEISKYLEYREERIQTPLKNHAQLVLSSQVVVVTILRAGLPLHQGILDVFDSAESGFVSAYRKHKPDGSFTIEVEYIACPSLEGKTLILNDPMLATGGSFLNAYAALKVYGEPAKSHFVSVIASDEGIANLMDSMPDNADLWTAAIDPELNPNKYIVPGLGDAGDLAFGNKLQG